MYPVLLSLHQLMVTCGDSGSVGECGGAAPCVTLVKRLDVTRRQVLSVSVLLPDDLCIVVFQCRAVAALVYCGEHLRTHRSPHSLPHPSPTPCGLLCLFSPTQINCLHLVKDASCRQSGICPLSPASSPFPLSLLLLLPVVAFLRSSCSRPHANVNLQSHLLYRILDSFCAV